jgi:hypothetical protein
MAVEERGERGLVPRRRGGDERVGFFVSGSGHVPYDGDQPENSSKYPLPAG